MSADDANTLCTDCRLPSTAGALAVARAVLRTIARLGETTTDKIGPHATFESLDFLPYWHQCGDVGFDSQLLADVLQEELGVRLSQGQLQQIRDPDIDIGMSVAEFVRDVYRVVAEKG